MLKLSKHKFLDFVIKRLEELDAESGRTVKHPNGFIKHSIPIRNDLDFSEIRVHLWPGDSTWSDVHNHTSAFFSLVLEGEIEEEYFKEGSGEKFFKYNCQSNDADFQIKFAGAGYEELENDGTMLYSTGNFRLIEAQRLHRARATKPTRTILLKGVCLSRYSTVYTSLPTKAATIDTIRCDNENSALHVRELTEELMEIRSKLPG